MLYNATTQTLTQVVMDDPTEEQLRHFAALKGGTAQGQPVRQVALVFMLGSEHAARHLDAIKRLGLECRAIDDGHERVLFADTGAAPVTAGELLPLLREESWPQVGRVLHRRLMEGHAPGGPWLTFALDVGNERHFVEPRHLGGGTIPSTPPEVEQRALVNLDRREFSIQRVGNGVSVTHEYGSEAILLPPLMRQVQQLIGSALVVVAVPKEGGFYATHPENFQEVAALAAWTRNAFDEARGRRISPAPLLARDGKVVGFVSV
jgi:hypothetical protein